jgi:fermentation-respiration switch protein FrsA (DUF1100 family)
VNGQALSARRVNAPRRSDWFTYFAEDYRWSAAMMLALGGTAAGAADIGEVDEVGRELRTRSGDDDAWFRAWCDQADRVRRRAEAAEQAGHHLTAAGGYLRASAYAQIGERFRTPKDTAALQAYTTSLDSFAKFVALTDRPRIEAVEVPIEDSSMPAYLVHADGGEARPPAVVYFDGLDITKELCYSRGGAELARRGVTALVIDGPGNGESPRFRGLPLRPDYEVAGSAALDYLETRTDIDAERVGVLGISLGGYYAARCASLDSRFRACVAWGAIWDYHATWKRRVESNFADAMSVPGSHITWVLGVDTVDDALERLRGFRLDGVVHAMSCPFMVLHGEHDEQIPVEVAQRLLVECGAQDKTLRVYTAEEGGAQHCQMDRPTPAVAELADWFADKLEEAH